MINEIVYNPAKPHIALAEHYKDQAQEFHIDANYWAVREGGALDSVSWSVLEGSATLGSSAESSNISSALVTTGVEGITLIQIKLTLDSAAKDQVGIQLLRISVPIIEKPSIKY